MAAQRRGKSRRKAYSVTVRGWTNKDLIVWADSVDDANRIADEERNGDDVMVCDTRYGEDGIVKSETRRLPSEDRDA